MKNILKIENEYINEIEKINISTKDLYDNKITAQTLKIELFLQSIYGDKFSFQQDDEKELNGKQKKINKISEDDIGLGESIKRICEEIEKSKFDEVLETIWR